MKSDEFTLSLFGDFGGDLSGALNSLAVTAGSEVQPGSVLTWTTGGETVCLAVTTLPEDPEEEEGEEALLTRGGLSEMERLRESAPNLCVLSRPI